MVKEDIRFSTNQTSASTNSFLFGNSCAPGWLKILASANHAALLLASLNGTASSFSPATTKQLLDGEVPSPIRWPGIGRTPVARTGDGAGTYPAQSTKKSNEQKTSFSFSVFSVSFVATSNSAPFATASRSARSPSSAKRNATAAPCENPITPTNGPCVFQSVRNELREVSHP